MHVSSVSQPMLWFPVFRPSGNEVISLQKQVSTLQVQVSTLRDEKEEEQKEWQEKYNTALTEISR